MPWNCNLWSAVSNSSECEYILRWAVVSCGWSGTRYQETIDNTIQRGERATQQYCKQWEMRIGHWTLVNGSWCGSSGGYKEMIMITKVSVVMLCWGVEGVDWISSHQFPVAAADWGINSIVQQYWFRFGFNKLLTRAENPLIAPSPPSTSPRIVPQSSD